MSKSGFKYFKKPTRICIAKIVTYLSLAYTITLSPCYAQQIITDGNTQTSLSINGNAQVNAGEDINLNAYNNACFYDNAIVNATRNINLFASNDAFINNSSTNAGNDINLIGNNSYIYNTFQVKASNNINLTGNIDSYISASNVNAGQNIKLMSKNNTLTIKPGSLWWSLLKLYYYKMLCNV